MGGRYSSCTLHEQASAFAATHGKKKKTRRDFSTVSRDCAAFSRVHVADLVLHSHERMALAPYHEWTSPSQSPHGAGQTDGSYQGEWAAYESQTLAEWLPQVFACTLTHY